jgi:hypothetical protein
MKATASKPMRNITSTIREVSPRSGANLVLVATAAALSRFISPVTN